jgi:predicted O-methyltransferase YrrM
MSQEQWTQVDRYITDHMVAPDAALEAALEASAKAGLPAINVAPNQGKLLMLLARMHGAKRILEVGTLGGYSTLWLARALPPEGRIITLEAVPKHAEVARENIARAGLSGVVEVRLGNAVDTLAQLEKEGQAPFDLTFIDADKVRTAEYFAWALKLSRQGSVILTDNVVHADSTDANIQGMRRFYEAVAAEPRVSATAVQTVGSKGYDGFALALVTG